MLNRDLLHTTAILACFLAVPAAASPVCQSVVRAAGAVQLDLAPPDDFVDVCLLDTALCRNLTAGYPASSKTLGYFVLKGEWSRHQADGQLRFSRYFIAQHASAMVPADLPGLKQFVHAQNGDIPDNTELPGTLKQMGKANLGVVNETNDSISFGVLMRLTEVASHTTHNLVAINSALAIKGTMLTLYSFAQYEGQASVEKAKQVNNSWLSCIRDANGK